MKEKMNCQIFARRLKDSMNDKGIKQIDLINQLNLNSGAVSCYIAGKYMPRNETMYKIAHYLGVSPAWLCGFDVLEEIDTKNYMEYLPYLAKASEETLKIVRKILDMPESSRSELEKKSSDKIVG